MSLSQELAQAQATLAGTCPLAVIRTDLTAEDRTALDAALAGTSPSVAVAMALTALGSRIAETDVRNHRAGDCPCAIPTGAPA